MNEANAGQAKELVYAARGISKHYGPIVACDDVSLDVHAGELIAIVGDNGAGKSTVTKIMTGAVQPDAGKLIFHGEEIAFGSPRDAQRAGIEAVQQELAIVPNLDVRTNLFLGREMTKPIGPGRLLRTLAKREMTAVAEKELKRLSVRVPALTGQEVGRFSGGQRQCVAIARGVMWSRGVIFMDEPTAALGVRESKAVISLIREVVSEGTSVVMVSHALPHVVEMADRVIVMRHGRVAATATGGELTVRDMVELIVGG